MIKIDFNDKIEFLNVDVNDDYNSLEISKKLNLLRQCLSFFEAKYTYEMNALQIQHVRNDKKN